MKKKQAKKLVLAKETVRDLEELTLRKAAGATGVTDQFWSCRVCYPDDSIDFSACAVC